MAVARSRATALILHFATGQGIDVKKPFPGSCRVVLIERCANRSDQYFVSGGSPFERDLGTRLGEVGFVRTLLDIPRHRPWRPTGDAEPT